MKLQLPLRKDGIILLFSNIGSKTANHFYLLMTFHRSLNGGFGYPVTVEQCKKALKNKNKNYKYVEVPE